MENCCEKCFFFDAMWHGKTKRRNGQEANRPSSVTRFQELNLIEPLAGL